MQNARGRQGGQNKENHADEQGKGPKKGEKERQAKRAERKLRQKELTVNISAAYQTIRPTIIQAQRILKIIDTLQAKFSITKYLNFEFVKHFEPQETQAASNLNSDSVSRLSKVTRGYLAKIAYIQSKIYELLEQEAPQQSETGEEEDDGYSKRDDDDDEDNKEAQERKAREEAEKEKLRQERENQVLTFRDKMEGDFNNLVRQLERDSSDYEIIKVKCDNIRA